MQNNVAFTSIDIIVAGLDMFSIIDHIKNEYEWRNRKQKSKKKCRWDSLTMLTRRFRSLHVENYKTSFGFPFEDVRNYQIQSEFHF